MKYERWEDHYVLNEKAKNVFLDMYKRSPVIIFKPSSVIFYKHAYTQKIQLLIYKIRLLRW